MGKDYHDFRSIDSSKKSLKMEGLYKSAKVRYLFNAKQVDDRIGMHWFTAGSCQTFRSLFAFWQFHEDFFSILASDDRLLIKQAMFIVDHKLAFSFKIGYRN